jgi:hypothetical protein
MDRTFADATAAVDELRDELEGHLQPLTFWSIRRRPISSTLRTS